MTTLPDIELFRAEMAAWCAGDPVHVPMSRGELWVVFSQLQLALRHPENIGAPSDLAISVAERLQGLLPDTPAIQAIAAAGWDPTMDEVDI